MKKVVRIIEIVIVSIVLIYALFITEESIRLSHNRLAKPLIVFKETYDEKGDITYKSFGFKLTNKYAKQPGSNDLYFCIGQDFWLFDTFLLWAWIS